MGKAVSRRGRQDRRGGSATTATLANTGRSPELEAIVRGQELKSKTMKGFSKDPPWIREGDDDDMDDDWFYSSITRSGVHL